MYLGEERGKEEEKLQETKQKNQKQKCVSTSSPSWGGSGL